MSRCTSVTFQNQHLMENKELDAIIKQQTPRLRSFVRGRVSNREDADDIVQDTLYQFVRTIGMLENPIAQVTSWLYTVAHNLIVNHDKKRREESLQLAASDHGDDSFLGDLSEIMIADDNDNPDMRLLRKMVWQELDKAMAELPEEQRRAIQLTEIEGLSIREAAERMQVPTNTLLSRKHYAVVHVRKRLHRLYQELTDV